MNHPLLANFAPGPQWFFIAILVLIMFGSKKLPLFARSLGRSMGEFRKAKEEFEQELHRSAEESQRPAPPAPPVNLPAPAPAAVQVQPHSATPEVKHTTSEV